MRKREKTRRPAVLLLLLLIAAALSAPVFAEAGFTDVPEGYWGIPYIELAKETGLIEGYVQDDGTAEFRPERYVTKQECLVMLYNTLQLASALEDETGDFVLSDFYADHEPVSGEPLGIPLWAREYVSYALDQGICDKEDFSVEADPDGRSGGYSYASRELIAKWTARALGCEEAAFFPLVYSDADEADPALRPYIDALYRHGIMQGSGGAFHPKSGVKRAEMATVCTRLLGVAADEEAGVVTDRGMIGEDGSVAPGEALYDREGYLSSLKLSDKVVSFRAPLTLADGENRLLGFERDGEEVIYQASPELALLLDGKPVSYATLASWQGAEVGVYWYFAGEPALIIQTAPTVQEGYIKDVKDFKDHRLVTVDIGGGILADYVLTSSSLTQGDIKKNRSCRFIADGIEILEMR